MRSVVPALFLFAAFGSPALHAQNSNRFTAYEHCKFADNLALMENTPLPNGVQGRTVQTIMGPKQVPLTSGTRLLFAYPQTEPFANVKVEQVPASGYTQAKQDLIANFEQILSGDDSSSRNYALKPKLNGLEIYGLDRKKLEGGVLGIYLFFVDRTHTVTTVYFLNQDPSVRSFNSLEAYAGLRDTFLNAYTSCVAGPARGRTALVHQAEVPVAPVMPVETAPAVPAPAALPEAPSVQPSAAVGAALPPSTTLDSGYVPPEAAPLVAHHAAAAPAHKPAVAGAKSAPKASSATAHTPAKPSAAKSVASKPAAKKRTSAGKTAKAKTSTSPE